MDYLTAFGISMAKLLSVIFYLWMANPVNTGEVKEYCFAKNNFNVTCQENHVILMEQALYGRMRVGDCIPEGREVGCSADVLRQVDQRCSGRQHCSITIPDAELHKYPSCPWKDQMFYLAAAYECQKVTVPVIAHCSLNRHINLAEYPGYISSKPTIKSTANHRSPTTCSYRLTVPYGQTINVTLYDFDLSKRYQKERHRDTCIKYANIKSGHEGWKDHMICGGNVRENRVFTSDGNKVTIDLILPPSSMEPHNFLLKYEAVGCPDPKVPPGAWYTRTGEGAVVRCNATAQTWHIVCKDNEWVGFPDNCTNDTTATDDYQQNSTRTFSFSLLVAVFIGVCIGIILGIGLLCFVSCVIKRQRDSNSRRLDYRESSQPNNGAEHTMMLQSKYYPCDHSYECTTNNPNLTQAQHHQQLQHQQQNTQHQTLPKIPQYIVDNVNDCNINCPYNALNQCPEHAHNLQKQYIGGGSVCPASIGTVGDRLPSIVKDTEGSIMQQQQQQQQQHFWNSDTGYPSVEDSTILAVSDLNRNITDNPVIRIKNMDNNEDLISHWPCSIDIK